MNIQLSNLHTSSDGLTYKFHFLQAEHPFSAGLQGKSSSYYARNLRKVQVGAMSQRSSMRRSLPASSLKDSLT
jgi:hypothetical protein